MCCDWLLKQHKCVVTGCWKLNTKGTGNGDGQPTPKLFLFVHFVIAVSSFKLRVFLFVPDSDLL